MNAGVLRLSSPGRWWSESEKQGLWRNVPLGQTGCPGCPCRQPINIYSAVFSFSGTIVWSK